MAEQSKTISSVSLEGRVFKVPAALKKTAYIKGVDEYNKVYQRSVEDPDGFWAECAEQLHWFKKWNSVQSCDFKNAKIEWFQGGKLNVSYNCLDRHLATRKNKAALIWEGEPEGESKTFTYQQLHDEVCRFANVLKKKGVKKGDKVITAGGIHGVVEGLEDKTVLVKIADGVKVKMEKSGITTIVGLTESTEKK